MPPTPKMRTTIELEPKVYDRLAQLAARDRVGMSAVIAALIVAAGPKLKRVKKSQ